MSSSQTHSPSPPGNMEDLTEKLQSEFATMTRQFQIGAKYLLDFPAEVPITSMRKIAAQAGVQPATLVRLAQSLGYEGWDDLKAVFVQSLRQMPKRYADQARKLIQGNNPRNALGRAVAAQADNIRLLEDMNAESMPAAVKLLSRARHVHIAGFRASFAPAYTFQYLYRLFRSTVGILRGDAGTLEMELRAIQKGDAVAIIGFAPYSRESLRVAEVARQSGARVVAICDSVVAPIALQADCSLVFSTETPSFFPSSTAASALVEMLIEQLLAKSGAEAVKDIARAEDELHQTGAYLGPVNRP